MNSIPFDDRVTIRGLPQFDAGLSMPHARWPGNVPERTKAVKLLHEAPWAEGPLRIPSLALTKQLAAENLETPPEGIDAEVWLLSLATVWRLKIAASLAAGIQEHDERKLQQLFDEAANARDVLALLASGSADPRPAQLRRLLQILWGEVLTKAPPAKGPGATRPQPRTGKTGSLPALQPVAAKKSKTAEYPAFQREAPKPKNRVALLSVVFVLALAGSLALRTPPPVYTQIAGVPPGWLLAGDPHLGPATVMAANEAGGDESRLKTWLYELEREGIQARQVAPHEWALSRSTE